MNKKNILNVITASLLFSCVPSVHASNNNDNLMIGAGAALGTVAVVGLVLYGRKCARENQVRTMKNGANTILEITNKYVPVSSYLQQEIKQQGQLTYENLQSVESSTCPLPKYLENVSCDMQHLQKHTTVLTTQKITKDSEVSELLIALRQKHNTLSSMYDILRLPVYHGAINNISRLRTLNAWTEKSQKEHAHLLGYSNGDGTYRLFKDMDLTDVRNYIIGEIHQPRPLVAYADQAAHVHKQGQGPLAAVKEALQDDNVRDYPALAEDMRAAHNKANGLNYVLNSNRTAVVAMSEYRQELCDLEQADSLRRQAESKEEEARAAMMCARAEQDRAATARREEENSRNRNALLEERNRQLDIENRVAEERRLDNLWTHYCEQRRLRGQSIPNRNEESEAYGGHREKNIRTVINVGAAAGVAIARAISGN